MTTKPKAKIPKVRAPEEVWYDVHKHPEGVPGGMGKSPEYHLRNRGWTGHEINGAGSKTMQYRNHEHPDFVVSYGGGTPQKPDHNFRVLYMGGNTNIPKVTRAYSVAEAMNKVEELHGLHNGLVVQPMTHGAALVRSRDPEYGLNFFKDTDISPPESTWTAQPMFNIKNDNLDFGAESDQGHSDICETCYLKYGDDTATPEHHEDGAIDHPFKPFGNLGRFSSYEGWELPDSGLVSAAAYGTKTPGMAEQPNISQQKTFVAPDAPPSWQDMTDDDMHPIGPPKVEFPTQPDREHDWSKKKPQLKEIPDPPAPKPKAPPKNKPVSTVEIKSTYASRLGQVTAALERAERDAWEEA